MVNTLGDNTTTTNNGGNNAKPLTKDDIVAKLHTADVLLGRGSPTINYEGNVAFRLLIKERKAEYTASGQHKTKDRVARDIFMTILGKGGRFLRRIDPLELEELALSSNQKVWVAVDEDIALEKVKQALRDKDQCKYRSRAKEAMQQQQQHQPQSPVSSTSGSFSVSNNLLFQQQSPNSMVLQQGLMLHHLMNQQKTSDLMVLAHLQQQLQRKQLIQNLFDRQHHQGFCGSDPLAGTTSVASKALAQQQQQPLHNINHSALLAGIASAPASAFFLYR